MSTPKKSSGYLYIVFVMLFYLCSFPLSAESSMKIVATNSWTAAFAAAAGSDSQQIASSNMQHPPEYELKPSDVVKIRDADLLVYAGYEVMMKTVFDSFKKPEEKLLKIETGYTPEIIEKSVMAIAVKTGNPDIGKKYIASYNEDFASAVEELEKRGLRGAPVIVQFHFKQLAEALGFKILAVFGPAPPEVSNLASIGKLKPALIIDNAHNPLGSPISEITGARTIELVNFPGFTDKEGTKTPESLEGMLKYNISKLLEKQENRETGK
ncbi:MAG: hypothetical protein RBT69_13450 [Spirochaetia bacterium]|jgi:hypothetical protein|nr:hypothetical protein [Spirochaetia bacterium]